MNRELWSKILHALRRRSVDDDLRNELRSHLQLAIDENIADGMSPDEARTTALRKLGNETLAHELAVEAWRFPRIESVLQDLRYGLRGIRRSPGFSLVVILTLALGIGVNAAMFSVVYSVLLRPLPFPSGERLVSLRESTANASGFSVSWLNFQHWRSENHSFDDMAAYTWADLTMTGRGDAVLTHTGVVTSNFLPLTGARPLLGRTFTAADDQPGAPDAVVVSGEFWSKMLAGDPAAVGATLTLNGKPYQIIGVLHPGTQFFSKKVDFFLPLGPGMAKSLKRSEHGSIFALGLLKQDTQISAARVDLNGIMQRLALEDPGPESDHRAAAEFLTESRTGEIRPTLMTLMGAAVLVLLIACANVASLLLVRSTTRAREMAIRSAIGAGRARLTRQLITENLAIAALGGFAGLILVKLCLGALVKAGPANIPRLSEASVDPNVLLFGGLVTVLVGLLAGLAPVYNSRKIDLTVALKEGSAASGGGKEGNRFRNGLVIAEIAVTVVLAFESGLLLQSLITAQTSSPGFDPDHVLALELQLPQAPSRSEQSQREFYTQLMESLRAEPGVESVGAINCPLDDCGDYWYSIPGKPTPARGEVPLALFNVADADYFRVMRIPLVAGRNFNSADRGKSRPVAIINQEIARKWWSTPQAAIGNQLKFGGPYREGPTYEIVGVAASVKQMGLDQDPVEQMYLPFSQQASPVMVVMIRTAGDPATLEPAARRKVAAIDRNVPIQSLRPFPQWLGSTLERRRFSASLLGLFALLAMTLSAVGIYGVLNYWVSVRQREIAIRVAMGARRAEILRWAGAHALRLSLLGGLLGAFGSWAASKWLKSELFGVSVQNVGTIVIAAAAVLGIVLLASSLPLLRATKIDAVRNLHDA
ncbi:MAG: ABC transporter permease [Bryobacteraceae bacterium]